MAIADLLQLEEFPPRADAPAAPPMGEPTARPEEVQAPAAKKSDADAAKPNDKAQPAAPADAKPKALVPPQVGRAAEPPALAASQTAAPRTAVPQAEPAIVPPAPISSAGQGGGR